MLWSHADAYQSIAMYRNSESCCDCAVRCFFFFQAEDGIRDLTVTGVQTCALPISLAEQLATRREQPLYEPPSGLASHGIASVRLLLRRLALKPALGPRKVFLIGDAERLVPQTGAEAAANALLKALEEPPPDTVFVLTSAEPDALLPTILSRVVRVRVARNANSIVTAFAQRELGLKSQRDIAERVTAADGSIGKLLAAQEGAAGTGDRKSTRLNSSHSQISYAVFCLKKN